MNELKKIIGILNAVTGIFGFATLIVLILQILPYLLNGSRINNFISGLLVYSFLIAIISYNFIISYKILFGDQEVRKNISVFGQLLLLIISDIIIYFYFLGALCNGCSL